MKIYSRKTVGRLSLPFVINDAQTNTISQTDGQKETREEAGSREISELQHTATTTRKLYFFLDRPRRRRIIITTTTTVALPVATIKLS